MKLLKCKYKTALDNKPEDLTESQLLYLTGFAEMCNLKSIDLLNTIEEISILPSDGFSMLRKYESTDELVPSPYNYNLSIIDFIKKNKILQKIQVLTQQNLCLCHIQTRRALKSNNSYMDWHRDTHFYKNEDFIGATPPIYKLIFFPILKTGVEEKAISLAVGSHLESNRSLKKDLRSLKNKEIFSFQSNNSKALFFNTSLLHKAELCIHNQSAFRVIYSFCTKPQLERYGDLGKKIHELSI